MIKSKIENYLKKAVQDIIRVYPLLKKPHPRISASMVELFIPENEKFGHYSTNVALKLAKIKGENPMKIAEEIKSQLEKQPNIFGLIKETKVAPPGFINFWLSEKMLQKELNEILKSKKNYGGSKTGKGKTIVIDYSAPNVAKSMTVGHLRSTILGQTLVNLFRFQGYKVIADNHLGDWGTQFGALLTAYRQWGNKKVFDADPIKHLTDLYVRFHKEAKKNDKLLIAARQETLKLQKGERNDRKLWKIFANKSLEEFNKIYKRLKIKFDVVLGESFYQPMLKPVAEETLKKGVAKYEDGALKIFYENRLPPLVIQKSDKAHLYSTTDLAAIKYRIKRWRPAKILYIVANEQSLHFEQIFQAAELLGYTKSGNVLEHIKFGMILGETGKKMSTRRGEFIKLENLLDKAKFEAAKINKEVAEAVGAGAVKYKVLSQDRKSDIVFNWKQMLELKGNSAPYLQYTYARLRSILRKAKKSPKEINLSLLKTGPEKKIIRQLIYFPDVVWRATHHYESNHLANYLFELANCANAFYESLAILKAEKSLREARLALIKATSRVIKTGLNLLGIETPEKM